jgi:hypothetical protein
VAQIPAAAASTALSTAARSALSFVVNLGASFLLSRLSAQDGPRLDNLDAAGGEYGVAMPRAYGEAFRLTGIFMAQADIKETKHTVGSGALPVIAGAASGAAEGFMLGGPVGAAIGAVVGGLLGLASPKQHYYTYSDTMALLLCDRVGEPPIEGVTKLWANGKLIFNSTEMVAVSETLDADGKLVKRTYGKNRWFKSLTIYGGSTSQPVDPVLSSVLSETSGYPFIAYIVVEDLQLAQFGNSIPPIEALAKIATGQSLADIAELIAGRAGIDPVRNLSTSQLAGMPALGYAVTSASNCWDALKPILPAFAIDCSEVSGQIRFHPRAQSLRATIPTTEMGAYVYGDNAPSKFTFGRAADTDLPKEVNLSFIDPARDYQANAAAARRSEGNAQSNIVTTLPIVLTADQGANAAALMLWDAWLGRISLGSTLTDTWISLAVGLAYAVPVGRGQHIPFRITRALRGVNGITEFDALSDEEVSYTASVAHTSGTMPDEESTLEADTRLILIDGPILEDAHDDYGFYVIMAGSASYWERGAIQVSHDGGVTYDTLIDQPLSSAVGDVTGTLAAGTTTGLDDTLDTTSVLTVVLLHDGFTLEDATDAELDNYVNFAFVGKDGLGEYIQWKTATKIAPKTWELTNLRRGRKGTDWAITGHVSGEEFAVLGGTNGDGRFRIVMGNTSGWGDALTFRGVTLHQDEADAATVDFTNTGEGKRPYSPVEVMGSWDGSNNLTISWTNRSRLNAGGLGIDDQANYEVEITTGAGTTLTATGATNVVYSAADQTTDGITPGDSITGRVRQLSDVNDGRWREFFLAGPGATLLHMEDDTTPLHLEDALTPFELG